ncbi:MAG: hypothetical protein ABR600_09450 [Actinomycetota bacterium]
MDSIEGLRSTGEYARARAAARDAVHVDADDPGGLAASLLGLARLDEAFGD